MPRATAAHRLVTLLAGVLSLAVLVSACGGSTDESQTNTGSTVATLPVSTTTIVPGGLQAACTPDALLPIVQAKYADSTLAEQVCLVPSAIATVKTAGAEMVVFLTQVDGAWKIVADGAVGDAAALLPKTFSTTLFNTWLDKRTPVAPRPSTTRGPGGGASGNNNPVTTAAPLCSGEGADQVCVTTPPPTRPPTIPTTTVPPTTPPPPPPPPVTTAPPVSWVS